MNVFGNFYLPCADRHFEETFHGILCEQKLCPFQGNNNAVKAEEGGGETEVGGVVEGATSGPPTAEVDVVKAVVEEGGYISLHLRFGVRVDIAPNQAIRIINTRK